MGDAFLWNGKGWIITNNAFFRSRFEKFLDTPDKTSKQGSAYEAVVEEILSAFSPNKSISCALDEAFALLPQAAKFAQDARLSDIIANQVYSAWLASRQIDRLHSANLALQKEKSNLEWNIRMAAASVGFSQRMPRRGTSLAEWSKEEAERKTFEIKPLNHRLAEITALIKSKQTQQEVSHAQSKIEFQALISQLFNQRRMEHVLIACRFYQAIFQDGHRQLQFRGKTRNFHSNSTDSPSTVIALEAAANQAIYDAKEHLKAFDLLLETKELSGATKQLIAAFTLGEFTQPLRSLDHSKKQSILGFYQKAEDLGTALDARDYSKAEALVQELSHQATDFDATRANATIQTAQINSKMYLEQARSARAKGDEATFDSAFKQALAIWPTNPGLTQFTSNALPNKIEEEQTIQMLDAFLDQSNHIGIWSNQAAFLQATSSDPIRQEKLRHALLQGREIENTILQAAEAKKRGDNAGSWERLQRIWEQYPQDVRINSLRSSAMLESIDFVNALLKAQELEKTHHAAVSLAWYLKAQKIYPQSDYAREGIDRLKKILIPDHL